MSSLRIVAAWGAVALIWCFVAGCTDTNTADIGTKVMSVEVGMSRSQVLAILGEPQNKETYGATEFWLYAAGSGSVLDVFPVALVEGRVTGVGRNLYDNVVRSKAKSDLEEKLPPKKKPQ
jgi:hypothetical protein